MDAKILIFILASIAALYMGTKYPFSVNTSFDQPSTIERPNCSEAYASDVNAYRACMAVFALQYNWYPSPIAGLFSYPVWNGFDGFWQDGVAIETLANWMQYGNNTMYKSVVKDALRDLQSLLVAYGPQPSYDDMAWYAMSYLRVHEVLGSDEDNPYYGFLQVTRDIYKWIWENGWDQYDECGGGFWFDQTLESKQLVENAQMLFLAAKLHRITGEESFIDDTKRIWKFIDDRKLIDSKTFLAADGINMTTCTTDDVFGPSYNMGLMIGALIEAGPVLNKTEDFVSIAHKMALATIHNLTRNGTMVEYCSPKCDDDAKLFKGIFMRFLRYFVDFLDRTNRIDEKNLKMLYIDYLKNNSDTVWKNSRCEPEIDNCIVLYKDGDSLHNLTVGPVFGEDYRGPYNSSCPITQTAVLDLFIASINSTTACKDASTCSFDPPPPIPKPLTCENHPCPPNQPCCEYESYYTCCETTQKCIKGYCE